MNLLPQFRFRILWAALAGVLLSGEFPPWNAHGLLVVPSVAGLLFLLRGLRAQRARSVGFIWGLAAFGSSVTWLWGLFQWFALALFTILAIFPALFAWMQGKAEERGITGWRFVLFTTINWSAWEFIRAELFPLRFPWITPGMAWGPSRLLPWIGVYGVSTLLVLVAALFVSRNPRMMAGACLLFLGLGASRWWPALEADPASAVRVAAVQAEAVSMDHRVQRTEALPADTQLAIWPEYALPYDLRANHTDFKRVLRLCTERNLVLVLGTLTSIPGGSEVWNTALTMDASGALGEHYKVHPVHFFNDGVPGKTALPVKTPLGVIGTPICFDCDYEAVVRKMTRAGAEFFAVPSMDVDTWGARQHLQHSMLFRLRACENARWMIVCASSGVSQIIDPHGHVHGSIAPLEIAELGGTLSRESKLAPYTVWGWLFPWLLLATGLFWWILLLIPGKRRR